MIEADDQSDAREVSYTDYRRLLDSERRRAARLHLGCGRTHLAGWTNVDGQERLKPDKVVALDKFPWPFESNSIAEIYSNHVFEHLLDTVSTMRECWRILKPGGTIEAIVPFGLSYVQFSDPTHYRTWTTSTVEFFCSLKDRTGYCEEHFELVFNRLLSKGTNSDDRKNVRKKTFRLFIRNLIPFRNHLQWVLLGMFDEIHFKLKKPAPPWPVECDMGTIESERRRLRFYG